MRGIIPVLTRFIQKNATTILAIGAATGAVISVGCAIENTKTFLEKTKNTEELSKSEMVKAALPVYAPTIISTGATIAMIAGGQRLNMKKQAVLMTALLSSKRYHKEYRDTLIELHGEEADKEVRDAMAVRESSSYHVIDCDIPEDKLLFYDAISKRPFYRYEREVIDAEYHFNRNYVLNGFSASLNDFYEMLGLEPVEEGDILGWWGYYEELYFVDFEHRPVKDSVTGQTVYVLEPIFLPIEEPEDY